MPPSAHRNSGTPTFIATAASLSLSGLDPFGTVMDPNLIDTPAWYPSLDDPRQEPLSPQHGQFSMDFGSGFASHNLPVSHEALHQPHYPSLEHSVNVMPLHYDPVRPHLDELNPISPLQTTYPTYMTPYPDSTGSSAPSDEPNFAEADEDKRKRNQAASARFRQKKKQREQHMMEQSRQMQERTKKLETDVENLKRENTFLKKLLVEKVDNMSDEDKAMLAETTGVTKRK